MKEEDLGKLICVCSLFPARKRFLFPNYEAGWPLPFPAKISHLHPPHQRNPQPKAGISVHGVCGLAAMKTELKPGACSSSCRKWDICYRFCWAGLARGYTLWHRHGLFCDLRVFSVEFLSEYGEEGIKDEILGNDSWEAAFILLSSQWQNLTKMSHGSTEASLPPTVTRYSQQPNPSLLLILSFSKKKRKKTTKKSDFLFISQLQHIVFKGKAPSVYYFPRK